MAAAKRAPDTEVEVIAADCYLVVFSLDGQRYGLSLSRVRRVIRALAVTRLPEGPSIVLGVIDLAGEVLPVVDLRARFGQSRREVRPSDHFIVATAGQRTVALPVDAVHGVQEKTAGGWADGDEILPGLALIAGAVKLADGLVLIHDLERLLSLNEEAAISRAIRNAGGQDEASATGGGG